jgi:hypothetical protein
LEPPKRKPLAAFTLTAPNFVDVFAFTFFASTTGRPLSYGFCIAELSTNLLFALSNLGQAQQKDSPICLVLQNN